MLKNATDAMKDEILSNIDNPAQLERLYRTDKAAFRRAFNTFSSEIKDHSLLGFWHERLNFVSDEISWGTRGELMFVTITAVIAGIIAKVPALFHIDEEFFYPRNIGFIVFPMLTAWFAWKNKLSRTSIACILALTFSALIFINALPNVKESDTLILSCIHLLFFLWSLLAFAFAGTWRNNDEKRLGFLRFNGELVVMTTLIVIAGGLMTAITVGLFSVIGFNIEELYFNNVVIFGLPAVPIAGTYLTRTNPQLAGKISPVIARIFSPIVLVMLVIYLIAMVYSGKDPYNDREFLMMFNGLLIGVMAIIFFSVAETSKSAENRAERWVLFLLSIVTIIVNGIALSAILFRIAEWGITPNRAAVLGGNILILTNLILVTGKLFRVVTRNNNISGVGKVIAAYLPVYFVWAIIVTFVFPVIFGFE